MSEDKVAYQQFNFQIALEKIETLTEQNNELLDTIDRLEKQLKDNAIGITHSLRETENNRFTKVSEEADAAMQRFTTKLRKEMNNAKSKQSKRESV
jgi:molecular chaperone DnaK (HSP70)